MTEESRDMTKIAFQLTDQQYREGRAALCRPRVLPQTTPRPAPAMTLSDAEYRADRARIRAGQAPIHVHTTKE